MAKIAVIAAALLLAAAGATAAIVVEAESFVASHNAGGGSIFWLSCSGASGGRAVEGFDAVGDWIEIMVTITETYGYSDSLRSAGEYSIQSDISMIIFGAYPGGGDATAAYHTVGEGIG
jgi:hypothetical protein